MSNFRKELEQLINRYSKENGSDTPDFALAEFLEGSLAAFDNAVRSRERYFGRGGSGSAVAIAHPTAQTVPFRAVPLAGECGIGRAGIVH